MLRPFAHPVACCCVLWGVVETGQTFSPVLKDAILLASNSQHCYMHVMSIDTTGDNGDLTRPMRKISDFYDDKYAKIALDCSGVGSKTGCGHKIQFTTTVRSRELELFSNSLEGSNYRESTVLSLASVCLCTDVPPPS